MSKFRKKSVTVKAIRWQKNGDHPLDDVFRPFEDTGKVPTEPREGAIVRYYRHPQFDGNGTCHNCEQIMHFHGWIDTPPNGHIVCPGDWVITEGTNHYPCKDFIFQACFEKIEE